MIKNQLSDKNTTSGESGGSAGSEDNFKELQAPHLPLITTLPTETPDGPNQHNKATFSLKWSNVNVFADVQGKEKQILHNLSGCIQSGELVAIMGASGSGKSTLLNYISGYIDSSMRIDGTLRIGGVEDLNMSKLRSICGYVLQEDILEPSLTVTETVMFSGRFRSAKNQKYAMIKRNADLVIQLMQLERCQNTRIGDGIRRGVSGGERKRAAIAAELVTDPKLLLLDEPTTGLDSLNAENVVQALKEMAQRDKIVITTIHQPNVNILKKFDRIIILHHGVEVYSGHFGNLRSFFVERGVEIPEFCNPVEFILNLLNLDPNSAAIIEGQVSEKFRSMFNFQKSKLIHEIVAKNHEKRLEAKPKDQSRSSTEPREIKNHALVENLLIEGKSRKKSLLFTFWLNFIKHWTIFFRNFEGLAVMLAMSIIVSALGGFLYYNMGYDNDGIQNRKGAQFYAMIVGTLIPLVSSAFAFSIDQDLIKKELLQGQYSPTSYFLGSTFPMTIMNAIVFMGGANIMFFLSKMNFATNWHVINFNLLTLAGILCGDSIGLLLSATLREAQNTITFIPMCLIPMALVCGLLVDLNSIPGYIKPIEWISYYKFMYQGLILNEFEDINGCKRDICNTPNEMGFKSTLWNCLFVLLAMFVVIRAVGALAFWFSFRKYSSSK